MPNRKILVSEAEIEVAQQKRNQQKVRELEQAEREKLIAQCHEFIGRIQSSSFIGKLTTVASLVWLKQVKESKVYKDVPGVGSWERFCNYLGMSRRKVDEDLQNLDVLGEEFLATCRQFSLGHRDLRKLRQSVGSGEINITSEALEIDGEVIRFDADKGDLQAAIETIVVQKEEEVQQREKKARKKEALSKETIRGLESENDDLIQANRRLKVFEKKPQTADDLEWCERQVAEIFKACVSFTVLCGKFIADDRLEGDRERQAKVSGFIENAQLALRDLHQDWVDQFIPYDDLHG